MPPWELVLARLVRCLDRLSDHDERLLRLGPSERAVAHRLAVYLEQEFPGWHVDCEYNRQGDVGSRKQVTIGGVEGDVDPDIIVHIRGQRGPNLVAVEIKPASASDEKKLRDRHKLLGYLADHRYEYAVFIVYGTGDDAGKFGYERM
jgi:hypothetical protein